MARDQEVVTPVNPEPLMTTKVAPVVGPEFVLSEDTIGGTTALAPFGLTTKERKTAPRIARTIARFPAPTWCHCCCPEVISVSAFSGTAIRLNQARFSHKV